MRPKLVRWSAASLVLIFVVMAESFTNTTVLVPTALVSSPAMAAADPSSAPNATQAIANFVFIMSP
jgi:hypothetical protein